MDVEREPTVEVLIGKWPVAVYICGLCLCTWKPASESFHTWVTIIRFHGYSFTLCSRVIYGWCAGPDLHATAVMSVPQCLLTPFFVANVRHAWLCECAVRAMRKNLKLSSDGCICGSKKCKRGDSGAYCGVWRSLRLAGAWRQESRFCVCAFDKNLASVAVKIFSRLIYKTADPVAALALSARTLYRRFESHFWQGCLSSSMLCCPVLVEALRWADHSSKESYHMCVDDS
jgi:hypothetical protein